MDKLTANELRIGNLVRLFLGVGDNGAQYKEYEINGVYTDQYGSSYWLFCNTWIQISDNLHPIPLTEEWLVRLGFLQSIGKYGNEFHILEKNGFTVMFTVEHWTNVDNESKYKNNWHVKNMLNGNKLKYVHQLQNLYWSLTGEELTIKSDKE